jgi:CBS domain-containing protein
MLVDSRPITNPGLGRQVGVELLGSARPPSFLRALLDYTLAARPPVGFVRDFVVEHSGEHRGEVDLKAGGLRPLTSLGRWAAVMTGTTGGSTPERLRRAVDAGLLTPDEGESLAGAQEHLFGLVMGLEVEALRADRTASTWVAPGRMDSLSRRHLREAFRAVARVQRSLESQWALRWDHG